MTAFFLNTRLGQSILLALGMLIAGGVAYRWADSNGYDRCQAEHARAVAAANVEVYDGQVKRDAGSLDAGKAADEAADAAVAAVDEKINETEEKVHVIYRDRPATAPVAPGACVHPVDPRVQDGIESAVDRANRANRSL